MSIVGLLLVPATTGTSSAAAGVPPVAALLRRWHLLQVWTDVDGAKA